MAKATLLSLKAKAELLAARDEMSALADAALAALSESEEPVGAQVPNADPNDQGKATAPLARPVATPARAFEKCISSDAQPGIQQLWDDEFGCQEASPVQASVSTDPYGDGSILGTETENDASDDDDIIGPESQLNRS